MAGAEKKDRVSLPDGFDPSSEKLKKRLNEKADRLNFIEIRKQGAVLLCGATRRSKLCRQLAGHGTNHFGYGRCKYHGGASTGAVTTEGKKVTSQNARKHGLFSTVLSDDEREVYHELLDKKIVSLDHEIFAQKAKIVVYLRKWKNLFDAGGEHATKTWRHTSDTVTEYYYAGTIEDPFLQRALETLRRLVDSHAKLTQQDTSSILDQINAELRAASQVDVTNSWGGSAVRREGAANVPGQPSAEAGADQRDTAK